MRRRMILAAIEGFVPDALIVDKHPEGIGRELMPTLNWLKRDSSCRCVLGLRDILDDPETVKREWRTNETFRTIRAYYDSIWVYGSRSVFDSITQYEIPADIAACTSFTGYLNSESRLANTVDDSSARRIPETPYILCTLGGGEDGYRLATQFIEAIEELDRRAILLVGPYMPTVQRAQLHAMASSLTRVEVRDSDSEADYLLRDASQVVAMGGYNTVCSILTYNKRALIVPRSRPRSEQLIRAQRLSELGYVDCAHPDRVSSRRIADWLRSTRSHPPADRCQIPMDGLRNIERLISRLRMKESQYD